MVNYVARVVLFDANWEHYQTLHIAMQRLGFLRTITADDGVTYELPDGTYYIQNVPLSTNATTVRTQVSHAAGSTERRHSEIVFNTDSSAWLGLNIV